MPTPQDIADALQSGIRSAPDFWSGKLAEALQAAKQKITDQWAQGEPYRVATGALLSGDPATAKQVIEQRFANTTPQDIYEGAMNTGLGMAPMGMAGIFAGVGAKTADVAKLGLAQELKQAGIPESNSLWREVDTISNPAGTRYSPYNKYLENPDYNTSNNIGNQGALPIPEQYRSILNAQAEEQARAKTAFEEGMRAAIEADARRAALRRNLQPSGEIPYPNTEAQRLKLEADRGWARK